MKTLSGTQAIPGGLVLWSKVDAATSPNLEVRQPPEEQGFKLDEMVVETKRTDEQIPSAFENLSTDRSRKSTGN